MKTLINMKMKLQGNAEDMQGEARKIMENER